MTTPDQSRPLDKNEAIREVHRRIGRNLLRFQEMEVAMKMILPYAHPDGAMKGVEAMRQYQKEHIDLKTLGYLFGQIKDAMQATPEFFERSAASIVAARNDLVHHFYKLPSVDMLAPEGLVKATAWLDKQFEDSEEWYQILRTESLLVLLMLMESNPELAVQYGAHHEQLLEQLPPNIEYIDQIDVRNTTWAKSRIVRLLQLAELKTEKRNGRTLLARAGQFIKTQSPEICPEEYGVRTLKDVLLASRMFEVIIEADGSTIAYRSFEAPASNLATDSNTLNWTITRDKSGS